MKRENPARITKTYFVRTYKGGNDKAKQGTWLHPKLTTPFARWLSLRFAIWYDEQIMQLLIEAPQWQQERREEANLHTATK